MACQDPLPVRRQRSSLPWSEMTENLLIIAFGVLLIVLSFRAKVYSHGMPPRRKKPKHPVTRTQRVVFLVFGVLALVLGMARVVAR
jgi:uncharacterized protein YhhL (DUF1145 family)